MKNRLIALKKYISFHPILLLVIIGVVIFCLFIFLDIKNGITFRDLLSNLTASIVEVFLLGLFVIVINKLSERKERIIRYKEEIDSYRLWKENEAIYRICGIVRSLNNINVTDIELYHCHLPGARLWRSNLQGADFCAANLKEADLFLSNLQGVNFLNAHLQGAQLWCSNLQGADFGRSDLRGANLSESDLQGADLRKANFQKADLSKTNLQGADLRKANFRKADLSKANLQGAIVKSNDWLKKLEKYNITGIENINEIYYIGTDIINGKTIYKIKEKVESTISNTKLPKI